MLHSCNNTDDCHSDDEETNIDGNGDSDNESSQPIQQRKKEPSSWVYKEKQIEEEAMLPTLDLSEDTGKFNAFIQLVH